MKAYLFDMDGTLVNSLNSIAYFANNALNKYGLPSIETEKFKLMVGNGAYKLVQRMIAEVGADESLFESVYNEYNTTYDNDFMHLTEPYEGIIDMLKRIKASGCKTAIISNKPHGTAQKICDDLFGDLIDVCFGQKEGIKIKPDPASVNEVIKMLDINKEDCVYCGDTIVDMQTGKNAGLYTIGVLWGFRDIEEIKSGEPQMIVEHPSEIADTLGNL